MSKMLNNKGITLIESVIAVLLTGIAVLGLISMQPMAWQSAGTADHVSRAVMIMQAELETMQISLMTGAVPAVKNNASVNVGNAAYTVNTTITETIVGRRWLTSARVTWAGNPTGVRSSLVVTRQMGFE